MKIVKNFIFVMLFTVMSSVCGQGLTLASGTTFTLGSSTTFSLTGNWTDSGTFTAGTGSTVIFNGASGTQTATISSGETFDNLTINKASGSVVLSNNINVNGTLTCTSGNLDLNSNSCTLGVSGQVSETSGNGITNGTISITKTLNAPSSVNSGNLGAKITSSANLGSTTITRGSAVQTGNTNSSITRYYDITPTTNTGLNATLVFNYYTSDLNGLTESTLSLFKSTDGGTTWTNEGGTVNTTAHTVTLSGIGSFSRWTLGSTSSPLPVELTSFTATSTSSATVELTWQTATEVNNFGFEIQRASSPTTPRQDGWEKIGFEQGYGNSNSAHNYSFTDKNTVVGNYSYRLKQIDTDGQYEYSDIVEVSIIKKIPGNFKLSQNYPNPFNPSTVISYSIPTLEITNLANVQLKIYDILGRNVAELVNTQQESGTYEVTFDASNLNSGIYFYHLNVVSDKGLFSQVRKMMLLK